MRLTGYDNDIGDSIPRGRLLSNPSSGKVFTLEGSEIVSFPFNLTGLDFIYQANNSLIATAGIDVFGTVVISYSVFDNNVTCFCYFVYFSTDIRKRTQNPKMGSSQYRLETIYNQEYTM